MIRKFNKKGDFDDWSEAFVTILVFLIVILLFYDFVPDSSDVPIHFTEKKNNVEAAARLNEYLNLNVEVHFDNDGRLDNMKMVELIQISYLNEDYTKMKEITVEYLESIRRTSKSGWNVEFTLIPEDIELEDAAVYTYERNKPVSPGSSYYGASISEIANLRSESFSFIPVPGQNGQIEINFYERIGVADAK